MFRKHNYEKDNKVDGVIKYFQEYRFYIRIIDTGIGFSEEKGHNLFSEGYQIDPSKNQSGGGTGFGLFLSKNIIQKHHGEIWGKSNGLSKGSEFGFYLSSAPMDLFPFHTFKESDDWSKLFDGQIPLYEKKKEFAVVNNKKQIGINYIKKELKRDSKFMRDNLNNEIGDVYEENCQIDNNNDDDNNLQQDVEKIKILYVEDSLSLLKLMRRMLEKIGCDCDTAIDGREGMNKIFKKKKQNEEYDLILTDNQMPNMNGREMVSILRNEYMYKGYVVGLTGSVAEEEVEEFIASGCDEVLHKPLNEAKLLEVLRNVDRRRNEDKNISIQ